MIDLDFIKNSFNKQRSLLSEENSDSVYQQIKENVFRMIESFKQDNLEEVFKALSEGSIQIGSMLEIIEALVPGMLYEIHQGKPVSEFIKEHQWNTDDVITEELLQNIENKLGTALTIEEFLIVFNMLLSSVVASIERILMGSQTSPSPKIDLEKQKIETLYKLFDFGELGDIPRIFVSDARYFDVVDLANKFNEVGKDAFIAQDLNDSYLYLKDAILLPAEKPSEDATYLSSCKSSIKLNDTKYCFFLDEEYPSYEIINPGTSDHFYLITNLYGSNELGDGEDCELIEIFSIYLSYNKRTGKWNGTINDGGIYGSSFYIHADFIPEENKIEIYGDINPSLFGNYSWYGIGGPGALFSERKFSGFKDQERIHHYLGEYSSSSYTFTDNGYIGFSLNKSEMFQLVSTNLISASDEFLYPFQSSGLIIDELTTREHHKRLIPIEIAEEEERSIDEKSLVEEE